MEKFDTRIIKILCVIKMFEICITNEEDPICPLSSRKANDSEDLIWYDDTKPLYVADQYGDDYPDDSSEYPIVNEFDHKGNVESYYDQNFFETETGPFVTVDKKGNKAVEWDFDRCWFALHEDGTCEWGE